MYHREQAISRHWLKQKKALQGPHSMGLLQLLNPGEIEEVRGNV